MIRDYCLIKDKASSLVIDADIDVAANPLIETLCHTRVGYYKDME
jgi:hypothetical protein